MNASQAIKTARRRIFSISKAGRRLISPTLGTAHLAGSAPPFKAKPTTWPIAELQCFENFYDLEADSSQQWRWSGPGTSFTLFARLDRSSANRVFLEVCHSPSPINWHNTFFECEEQMQLCRHHATDRRHYLEAALPPKPGHCSALVRYHIQETRRPTETTDERMLGLRVVALHAERA